MSARDPETLGCSVMKDKTELLLAVPRDPLVTQSSAMGHSFLGQVSPKSLSSVVCTDRKEVSR